MSPCYCIAGVGDDSLETDSETGSTDGFHQPVYAKPFQSYSKPQTQPDSSSDFDGKDEPQQPNNMQRIPPVSTTSSNPFPPTFPESESDNLYDFPESSTRLPPSGADSKQAAPSAFKPPEVTPEELQGSSDSDSVTKLKESIHNDTHRKTGSDSSQERVKSPHHDNVPLPVGRDDLDSDQSEEPKEGEPYDPSFRGSAPFIPQLDNIDPKEDPYYSVTLKDDPYQNMPPHVDSPRPHVDSPRPYVDSPIPSDYDNLEPREDPYANIAPREKPYFNISPAIHSTRPRETLNQYPKDVHTSSDDSEDEGQGSRSRPDYMPGSNSSEGSTVIPYYSQPPYEPRLDSDQNGDSLGVSPVEMPPGGQNNIPHYDKVKDSVPYYSQPPNDTNNTAPYYSVPPNDDDQNNQYYDYVQPNNRNDLKSRPNNYDYVQSGDRNRYEPQGPLYDEVRMGEPNRYDGLQSDYQDTVYPWHTTGPSAGERSGSSGNAYDTVRPTGPDHLHQDEPRGVINYAYDHTDEMQPSKGGPASSLESEV